MSLSMEEGHYLFWLPGQRSLLSTCCVLQLSPLEGWPWTGSLTIVSHLSGGLPNSPRVISLVADEMTTTTRTTPSS